MKRLSLFNWVVICALAALLFGHLAASESQAKEPLVVFLVRHAEKVDLSRDPKLSAAGTERALQLANVLRDAGIKYIHSSDYIRTRDTAAPIADCLGLEVKLYDPRDLPSLATKLRQLGNRHLVVGHSTTTPEVVELLGGKPGEAIDEAGEFDRLYIVTVASSGNIDTILMRYGKPFAKGGVE